MQDRYQQRYQAHQERKKCQLAFSEGEPVKPFTKAAHTALWNVLERRRSQRVFTTQPIEQEKLDKIIEAAALSPSSCNRHGVLIKVASDRREKALLSGIVVGGVGWIHRADKIVLFLADPEAYKSPNEKDFMHYCDMGFAAMSMWLVADSLNIGACYVNPNVSHKEIFAQQYGPYIFCGALALGHYDLDRRATRSAPIDIKDIML